MNKYAFSTKTLAALLSVTLVFGGVVGGTVAWLTTSSTPVVNTFTYGDIDIKLTETTGENYKVIPGKDIFKDPKVSVVAGSEACWLFVKIEKSEEWSDKLTYDVAEGWTALDRVAGVYYREVSAAEASSGDDYPVLNGNTVTVASSLTKTEVEALKGKTTTLTFTAYAVQKEKIETAEDAWNQIPQV